MIRYLVLILALIGFSALSPTPGLAQQEPKIEIVPILPHTLFVNSVAFSPDGRRVISGGGEGLLKLWDVKTGRLIRNFKGHKPYSVRSVAFSPDGLRVISGGEDKRVKLWDVNTGQLIRTFEGHLGPASIVAPYSDRSVAFSPDGQRVLSASEDKTIKLWEAATGQLVRTFGGGFDITSVAFSPDGLQVIAGRTDDGLTFWDVNTGQLIRFFEGHSGLVRSVAFSPDGMHVISGGEDKTIKLWEAATGQFIRTFEGHSDSVRSVAFSPDGQRVLSISEDKTIKLWEAATGRLIHSFEGDSFSVHSVAFSPDGLHVISGGADGSPKLWETNTGQLVRTFSATAGVSSVAFSPDGQGVLSGNSDHVVKLWDVKIGRLILTFEGHSKAVSSVAFSPDGQRVLSGSGDKTIKLWEAATGRLIRTFDGHSDSVRSVAFFPDGQRVLSASDDETAKVWNANTGRLIRTFGDSELASAAVSPDGLRVLLGSNKRNNNLRLFELKSGRLIRTLDEHIWWPGFVFSVAFSPDGQHILSAGLEHEMRQNIDTTQPIKLWEANTGKLIRGFRGSTWTDSVAFSPDGHYALSGSRDNKVSLWEVSTGRLIRTLEGHSGFVRSVAFSPDGQRVVSASRDNSIKIWNLQSGKLLASLIGARDGEWIVITPEGFFAASGKGMELLSVVRGLEVYPVDRLFQSLYRPDLVREKLAGDPRGMVRAAAARLDLAKVLASGGAPGLKLLTPLDGAQISAEQVRAEVELSDQGGGIGRVEWRVNGVVVGVEDRSVPAAPNAALLRVARNLWVQGGENDIEVVAYNQQNLVASVPAQAKIIAQPAAAPTPPHVYVLAIGLNDYAERGLRLAHAVADAQALATAFPESGRTLYQAVDSVVLRDADVTRAGLDTAFSELAAKIRPQDIFVFFIAGHGKTIDGRYYFIPQNFRRDGADGLQSVLQQGITQEQWQRWFATIPAKRSLLLFDTCESGSLTGEALETRALERTAAHGRLVESTGRTIITASTDTGPAYEGFRGHGLFAYNLLGALQNADTDNDGMIKVSELAAYTYSQVLEVSEQVFNLRQVPQIQITGTDYPVGKPTPVLEAAEPAFKIAMAPTHVVTKGIASQVRPLARGMSVRKLDPNTPVTVLDSEQGWALIAMQGKPIGYVPLASIDPIQDRKKQPRANRPN